MLLTELTGTYSDGYRDQNAIIYLLKKHADEYIPHVEFVGKEFCFNCFWKDLLEVGPPLSAPAWAPALSQHKSRRCGLPASRHSCGAYCILFLPLWPASRALQMSGRTLVTSMTYSSALYGDTLWVLTVSGLVLPGWCHYCLSLGGAFEREVLSRDRLLTTSVSQIAPA